MAPAPPGNPLGVTTLYDSGHVDSSTLFQYGDSLTSCAGSQLNGRGGRCQSMLVGVDSEDDTHIYETPKYLRREKAATMKMKGLAATTQFYEDKGPITDAELMAPAAPRFASKTLPRQVTSSASAAAASAPTNTKRT